MMVVDKCGVYLQRGPFQIVPNHNSLCMLGDQQLDHELQTQGDVETSWTTVHLQVQAGCEEQHRGGALTLSAVVASGGGQFLLLN